MAMLTARDVMTDSVVSVSPETSLVDVLRLFVEENIHGAPVVDEEGRIQGVITSSDLLRSEEEERNTVTDTSAYFREIHASSSLDWTSDVSDLQDRLADRNVAEVMTKQVLSVSSDTPVAEIARCLRENQIHRVWVEDAGQLCGVVSALDLMPVIERSAEK